MSDIDVTKKLYSTTDAMIWAKEWCRIAREIQAANDGRQVIDEGWMVSWFANAMYVAAIAQLQLDKKNSLDRAAENLAYVVWGYTEPNEGAVAVAKGQIESSLRALQAAGWYMDA